MSEENNDANTGAEDTTGTGPSPDAEDNQPYIDDDGLVGTMASQEEGVEDEEGLPEDDDPGDADDPDDAGKNISKDQASDKTDFHEHPRFKELIEEKNALKQELDALKVDLPGPDDGKAAENKGDEAPNYRNIMGMEDDDIVEELTSSPKSFLANFAMQVAGEIRAEMSALEASKVERFKELSVKEQQQKNISDFFSDKPDGKEMLSDGRLEAYVKENPGHNEMSAYYALNSDNVIKSAVDKSKAKQLKELKAKGKAKSTSSAPGGKLLSGAKSPEMRNPEKFGGTESVLLKRYLARQKT